MLDFNFHPPLVGLPLAFIFALLVSDLCCLRRPSWHIVSFFILGCAALSTVAAFISGYLAHSLAGELSREIQSRIESHHQWGKAILFVILPCLFIRVVAYKARYSQRILWVLYGACFLGSLILITYTGYLGGQLVFSDGVGVYKRSGG